MKKIITFGGAVTFALFLTACGGGADGDATSSTGNNTQTGNVTATDAQVIANVKSSNIDFNPGDITLPNSRPAGTWRWLDTPAQKIAVYITAPTSDTERDYSAKTNTAISLINTKLAGLLVLEATSTAPTSGNYIEVSYGTSYVPDRSTNYAGYCANVSKGPNLGNPITPDNQNGIASNPVYINLGNGNCNVTQEIVTHEFGHALGLANHFDGFGGSGDAISTAYWDVLATLYKNPQSTVATSLVVERAK